MRAHIYFSSHLVVKDKRHADYGCHEVKNTPDECLSRRSSDADAQWLQTRIVWWNWTSRVQNSNAQVLNIYPWHMLIIYEMRLRKFPLLSVVSAECNDQTSLEKNPCQRYEKYNLTVTGDSQNGHSFTNTKLATPPHTKQVTAWWVIGINNWPTGVVVRHVFDLTPSVRITNKKHKTDHLLYR